MLRSTMKLENTGNLRRPPERSHQKTLEKKQNKSMASQVLFSENRKIFPQKRQKKETDSQARPAISSENSKCARKIKDFLQFLGIPPSNKIVPTENRVQERHLELEPLCCISSCLVRGGCLAVVAFEMFYAFILGVYSFVRMWYEGHFQLWRPLEWTVSGFISHHIFLYFLLIVAVITILTSLLLLRGLLTFDRQLLLIHFRFDYAFLVFNAIAALMFALALSSEGVVAWSFLNVMLFLNFTLQIPTQLWAISVVRNCADFFSLINVFITLANK